MASPSRARVYYHSFAALLTGAHKGRRLVSAANVYLAVRVVAIVTMQADVPLSRMDFK